MSEVNACFIPCAAHRMQSIVKFANSVFAIYTPISTFGCHSRFLFAGSRSELGQAEAPFMRW